MPNKDGAGDLSELPQNGQLAEQLRLALAGLALRVGAPRGLP